MEVTLNNGIKKIEIDPFHQQRESADFMLGLGVQPEAWAAFAEGRNNLFQNDRLLAVAARHGKTIDQVVLRCLVRRAIVGLARSVRKERMQQNLAVFDFELSDEQRNARRPQRDAEPWNFCTTCSPTRLPIAAPTSVEKR